MRCEYCDVEKDAKHPTIQIQYKGMTKDVYVCPICASKNSIGDLLVAITLKMKEGEKEPCKPR